MYVINNADYEEIYTPKVYKDKTQAWRDFALDVLETAKENGFDTTDDIEYIKTASVSLEDIKAILYDTAFKITTGEPITDKHNMYLFDEDRIEIYQDLSMFKINFDIVKIDEIEISQKGEYHVYSISFLGM